jgi:hypothetical protein
MTYAVAAMAVVMVFESWCLWRVLDRLGVVGRVEDRLLSLTQTIRLLTDTTETCFQVIAGQLELEQSQRTVSSNGRAVRQRRVVGAARRGRSMTEIAAEEEIAEGEVRLRLHFAEQDGNAEREHHG